MTTTLPSPARSTVRDAYALTSVDLGYGAWTVVSVDVLGETPALHLASGWTEEDLRTHVLATRAAAPAGARIAVLATDADAGLAIAACEAGADACVRGFEPQVVRAYLSALHRRRCARGSA